MLTTTQKREYKIRKLAKQLSREIHVALVPAMIKQPDIDYILFLEDFFKQYIETLKGRINA